MADPRHPRTDTVVVLTAGGVFPEIVINALAPRFDSVVVLMEEPETVGQIFRRWVKLRGWPLAIGQLAFGPIQKLAALRARSRRAEILKSAGLDPTPNPRVTRRAIGNVNSEACRDTLREQQPKVVLVVGTRMIRRPTLASVDAPFINYHAGINPQYRGQYGGYWAFAKGDDQNAGVTVHLVDQGVDTGAILFTAPIERTAQDNVATYHYLQVAAAVPIVLQAVEAAIRDRLEPVRSHGPSAQWFHPTLWEYLGNGLRTGIW
jgi:folate-dependent phosphoribosylglycinamide formyltransferase PurN